MKKVIRKEQNFEIIVTSITSFCAWLLFCSSNIFEEKSATSAKKKNAGNPLQSGSQKLSNKDNILNWKAHMKHNGEQEIGTFLIARRWRML